MQTNLGDLIYALTEEVRRHIRDEKLVYEIVADLLAGMTTARGKINFIGHAVESHMAGVDAGQPRESR